MERDQQDSFWSLWLGTAPPQNDLRKIMFENYAIGGIIYKMRYKERKCKIVRLEVFCKGRVSRFWLMLNSAGNSVGI